MPYKLRKAPGKDLYWVVNKETKKKLSKIPMAKEQAMAQMRAVYMNESKSGGAMSPYMSATNTLYNDAEQFRNSIESDNTRQLAGEATRERNKGAMASALAEQSGTVPELSMMRNKVMGKGMWDAVAPTGDYEFDSHLSGGDMLGLTAQEVVDLEAGVENLIRTNAGLPELREFCRKVQNKHPEVTLADLQHIYKTMAERIAVGGGKRSHKAQYVRWLAGKSKAKNNGYKHPYTPFIPKRVSVPKRSAFIHRMIASKEVITKRDAKKGVKAPEVDSEEEEAPAPVAKDKKARARELKAEGLSTRKIAEKLKEEGFSKVSPSTVVNLLKGSGYDEHPEDFFF